MTFTRLIRILLLSSVVALAFRGWEIQHQETINANRSRELCELVGNDLDAGNLRGIYEGIQHGLDHSGVEGACVVVTNHERSFSPDCLKPEVKYQSETCKAENNLGVRASVFFIQEMLVSKGLFSALAFGFLILMALALLSDLVMKSIINTFAAEISSQLGLTNLVSRTWRAKAIEYFLEKCGISSAIKSGADHFRSQIVDFELRVAAATSQKLKSDYESKARNDYIMQVKTVMHDIRNPLSSLQIVREKLSGQKDIDKIIFGVIKRLEVMIDQLADVNRKVEDARLIIAELAVDDVIFSMRARFKSAKGVSLDFNYEWTNLSPVKVGLEAFTSVIENLLQNSFDAVGSGGSIDVSIRSTPSECLITVADNGTGIDKNFLPQLFQRGATDRKTDGTGLGLFTCRRNVEAWGGQISYEPRDAGTAFIVRLPLTQTGVQFVGLAPGLHIKVIDDDPSVANALRAGGYRILATAETFEAGKMILEVPGEEHDVTLVDYRLNDEKLGTDLINEFKSRTGTMLLCTNDFDDVDLIKKAKALGVKILPKPICFSIQASALDDHHG